jgi:hypothetical protein
VCARRGSNLKAERSAHGARRGPQTWLVPYRAHIETALEEATPDTVYGRIHPLKLKLRASHQE